ncbi:zona pellucida-like domain-containing protein 1 [Lampetra planeri]
METKAERRRKREGTDDPKWWRSGALAAALLGVALGAGSPGLFRLSPNRNNGTEFLVTAGSPLSTPPPPAGHEIRRSRCLQVQLTRAALLVLLLVTVARAQSGDDVNCDPTLYNRMPLATDMVVSCGAQTISLTINFCPVLYAGYTLHDLALNGRHSELRCRGRLRNETAPASLLFHIPLSALESCGSTLTIVSVSGSNGESNLVAVQSGNVSGYIDTPDPPSVISYLPDLLYRYTCLYPLQYIVNNSQLSSASAVISYRDSNGTFISTLHMLLYNDSSYSELLHIPSRGLELKTRIYAAVRAKNLDERWHVLLDYCYATPSGNPSDITRYDLFLSCKRDPQTTIIENARSQVSKFSFEVFRFVRHKHQHLSTIFLHCNTRLCREIDCPSFGPSNCPSSRWRRGASRAQNPPEGGGSNRDIATLSAGPIVTRNDELDLKDALQMPGDRHTLGGPALDGLAGGLLGALLFVGVLCLGLILLAAFLLVRVRRPLLARRPAGGTPNPAFN